MPLVKAPKRLNKNPLIDAIAEVRFSSNVPPDTIVGLVYGAIKDDFGAPEPLPILQVPAALRDQDPNLRYQACYRFQREGHTLMLGPRNVALSTVPYVDWNSAEPRLNEVLMKLDQAKLFQRIERVGLRYVNFFEKLNVIERSTLKLEVGGKSIADQSITLRAERKENECIVITQIINNASLVGPQAKVGSIIDIDVVTEKVAVDTKLLSQSLLKVFTEANKLADKAFFSLLTSDFINEFEPEF